MQLTLASGLEPQDEDQGTSESVAARAAEMPRLNLLGGFGLQLGGTPAPMSSGAQRLIALLALHDTALSRDYVAGMLWGDSTDARASGSLRSALWKLRVVRPEVVWNRNGHLGLSPRVHVDVRHATALARSVITGRFGEETIAGLLEPRFCHELLPGWYDDWVLIERERHRQLSLHALESACNHLTEAGRFDVAIIAALAAVSREPLRESAHRALLRVHMAEGNIWEAIAGYRRYEEIAERDLGVKPSPMMRSLLGRILAD
ncbi:MAG TPA: BTAD domain-containing putative transcriptional regulator [Streptosporangiaceae bacterium]|nr:BTAD domain-containing putative transcriptional regulator [Streptosporangiaceae bacterium]